MLQRLNLAFSLLLFSGLLSLAFYVVKTQEKLVYVNTSILINDYMGMQDAREAYKIKATTWKSNVDTLASELKREFLIYEKFSPSLTSDERKQKQDYLRMKQSQLNEYQQVMTAQAQQEDTKMTSDVLQKINAYLKKYGEENGYKIVMAVTEYGNIAYADKGLDITEQVLTGLNKEYGIK